MRDFKVYRWVYCILFTAVGILLSMTELGLPGSISVLLVLHFPVLLAGIELGPLAGALTGLAIPILASLLTGSPGFMAMTYMMTVQLILSGFLVGLLTDRTKLPRLLVVSLAITVGWIGYWAMFLLLPLAGIYVTYDLSTSNAVIDASPGILLLLVLIRPISEALDKFSGKLNLLYD